MGRDEAGTPSGLVAVHTEVEEVAEHRDRGHHSHEHLAVEGEDGQEEDRVGMNVEHVEATMLENGIEEAGEGRNHPRADVVQEEGITGTVRGLRHGGGNLERGIPPFAITTRRHEECSLELLLGDRGRD